MSRFLLPAILALAAVARAQQPALGQLDGSPTLFAVIAAINAAGYDTDLDSPQCNPLRKAIRASVEQHPYASVAPLKEFFAQHRKPIGAEELSQYVSFALSSTGAPTFALKRTAEVPPDATALSDFAPLVAAFYKEAGIAELWKESQPAIEQYLAFYHHSVLESVAQVNAYLRQQTSGFTGRRFQIFVELLAAPNQIQTRSYGDEYFIVVTPSAEPRAFEVRHAYLHYLLDPLATRAQEIIERKKGLADHAQRAPALDDSFKQDFLLLTTESLIKAVESRLDRRPDTVETALRHGYILTPYFAERLPVYEKQEQDMAVYYTTMIGGIDLIKEDARLSQVEFVRDPPGRMAHAAPPPLEPALTGAAKTLEDAEQAYAARGHDAANLDKAKALYLAALQETDQKPMHAAAYYGLGRIAALQKDPESAQQLFEKALQNGPQPAIKAWVLVYLGRLSLASQEPDKAVKYFQDALAVTGASTNAIEAAQKGAAASSQAVRDAGK